MNETERQPFQATAEGGSHGAAGSDACRTILFGGTFDPVHNAHLEIAREAAALYPAASVLFIPAARPPHKNHGPWASFEDRFRMVQIACATDARFEASRIEEGTERSYTIHTIEKLRDRGPLAFLIGADAFAEIRTWHRWQDVIAAVQFVVAARPGASYESPRGARVRELAGVQLPESSSGIRRMIGEGAGNIPVPFAVLDYIHAHGLYRSHVAKISQTPSTHGI